MYKAVGDQLHSIKSQTAEKCEPRNHYLIQGQQKRFRMFIYVYNCRKQHLMLVVMELKSEQQYKLRLVRFYTLKTQSNKLCK